MLRKEQNVSQKKVAADLGISQALLSHYEKGVRECGLEFVVKAAQYYHVSTDYLLGLTPQRNGSVIAVRDLPSDASRRPRKGDGDVQEYDRRLLTNSLNIVFGILKKINSPSLTKEIDTYLSCAVYTSFRVLYSSNPKNPQGAFALDGRMFDATINSCMAMCEARSRCILSGDRSSGATGVKRNSIPSITPETLLQEFPQAAPSLFDLIHNTEASALGEE